MERRSSRLKQPARTPSQGTTRKSAANELNQIPIEFRSKFQMLKKENDQLKMENDRLKQEVQDAGAIQEIQEQQVAGGYDQQRMQVYRTKIVEQERLIQLLSTTVDNMRSLYHEVDYHIKEMNDILTNVGDKEQCVREVQQFVGIFRKRLREIENNCRSMYNHLIQKNSTESLASEVEVQDVNPSQVTIKLDGGMVLQAEEAIASFLDDITNNNAENLASKARVVGQMLLQLGVKLPIGGKFQSEPLFTKQEYSTLLRNMPDKNKQLLKNVLGRVNEEKKRIDLEQQLLMQENQEVSKRLMEIMKDNEFSQSSSQQNLGHMKRELYSNVYEHIIDLGSILENNEDSGSAALQLEIVFRDKYTSMMKTLESILDINS